MDTTSIRNDLRDIRIFCLTPESLILTNRGLTPIRAIKAGDLVYCHHGCFTKVIKTTSRKYEGDIVRIKATYGAEVALTPEHPILSLKLNYNRRKGLCKSILSQTLKQPKAAFRPAGELLSQKENYALAFSTPGRYVKTLSRSIYKVRKHFKMSKVTFDQDFAYFLGWFLADGHLGKVYYKKETVFDGHTLKGYSKYRTIVITANKDNNIDRLVEIVRRKLHRTPNIYHPKGEQTKRVIFSSTTLTNYLRKHCYEGKDKKIPTWMLNMPNDILADFVKGLVEGDGYVDKHRRATVSSVFKGIYSLLPLILMKLRKTPSIEFLPMPKPQRQKVRISWQEEPINRGCLYTKKRLYTPIRSITKEHYAGYVYNLQTKAGTYAVPYFIVHNCGRYFPFIVIPLSYARIIASEHAPTAGVDKKGTLVVNPTWWTSLDVESKRYVAIHECLHICLCHPFRLKGFNREAYNICADGKVNHAITEANVSGVDFKNDGLVSLHTLATITRLRVEDLEKMSTEEIVKILESCGNSSGSEKDQVGSQDSFGDDLLNGEVDGETIQEGDNSVNSPKTEEALKQAWKQLCEKAKAFAKQVGTMPASLKRIIDEILQVKPPWQMTVRFGLRSSSTFDSSYAYPNRRNDDLPGPTSYKNIVWCLVDRRQVKL